MSGCSLPPSKEIEEFFAKAGFRNFALVDPAQAFTESNELWKNRRNAFIRWIHENKHGAMSYLEQNLEIRTNPIGLLPKTKSALVFLVPYSTGKRVRKNTKSLLISRTEAPHSAESRTEQTNSKPRPQASSDVKVARYARHKDYHKVIKKNLNAAIGALQQKLGIEFNSKIIVDSVPFLDRAHAELAGLGFVGKNTMLIRPGLGSYFFIASVLLDLDLTFLSDACGKSPDSQAITKTSLASVSCKTCTKCVDACPTQALDGQYKLDATKCFSYWSIESRTVPPNFIKPVFKDLFFGCDICQEVCPYNEFTLDERSFSEFLEEAESLHCLKLEQIAVMSTSEYESWFGGLPLTRAKYSGLIRNALYSLAAQEDPKPLQKALDFWVATRKALVASGQEGRTYSLIFESLEDILQILAKGSDSL